MPAQVLRPDLRNPLDLVRERHRDAPEHVAFRVQTRHGLRDLTLGDFMQALDRIGAALLRRGVEAGDHVAIIASTSYGWTLAEWGAWRAGAVVVPIYETAAPATVTQLLEQVQARLVFVDQEARERLPSLPGHQLVDLGQGDELAHSFGVEPTPAELEALEARSPARQDTATIVFTSGSGAEPKGTLIAHSNLVDLVLNVNAAWSEALSERGRTVIFLPLSHILARGLQTVCLWAGMRVSYMADPKQLVASLPELRPTFLVVVPRVLEKVVDAATAAADRAHLGWLWRHAQEVAVRWGQAAEEADRQGRDVNSLLPPRTRLAHRLYEGLFYQRLRARLGGSMEFLLSGAAPLEARLSLLMRGMGLPVMEGYGLTETTAPLAGNRPGRTRSGTVGELVPGTRVRTDQEGVIWVKGIGVAKGYLDPVHTQESFKDGWLNTGDLGELDPDGYLTITGRAKDVLVTSGGKTVSPARWEAQVCRDPLVAHALVVGDQRPYLAALLLLDPEALAAQGLDEHLPPPTSAGTVVTHPGVLGQVERLVAAANTQVSRAEAVKRFGVVLVDLGAGSGLVTPTLKLRRQAAVERLAPVIASLYEQPAG